MHKVLVLDNRKIPLNICDWKRAATLIMAGRAVIVECVVEPQGDDKATNGATGQSSGQHWRTTVIALTRTVERQPARLTHSRRNIFHRDDYTCRYCRAHGKEVSLTLDHIVPRCQGGKNSWENLATACAPCNNRKGGRNLEESGMQLTFVESRPTEVVLFQASLFRKLGINHPSWDKYFLPLEKAA